MIDADLHESRINNVAKARNCDTGLCNVGGQNNSSFVLVFFKNSMLILVR